jgi:hypothetical protein
VQIFNRAECFTLADNSTHADGSTHADPVINKYMWAEPKMSKEKAAGTRTASWGSSGGCLRKACPILTLGT